MRARLPVRKRESWFDWTREKTEEARYALNLATELETPELRNPLTASATQSFLSTHIKHAKNFLQSTSHRPFTLRLVSGRARSTRRATCAAQMSRRSRTHATLVTLRSCARNPQPRIRSSRDGRLADTGDDTLCAVSSKSLCLSHSSTLTLALLPPLPPPITLSLTRSSAKLSRRRDAHTTTPRVH